MEVSPAVSQGVVRLRPARVEDAASLAAWDHEPHVISATSDDPDEDLAFGVDWAEEIAGASALSFHLVAELDGRPIGALQIIDPRCEASHYWGEIEPGLRAIDIWIGPPDALGRGYGTQMMTAALDLCFAEPEVTAVVIDPLASNTAAHRFYRRLGFSSVERRLFNEEDDCLVHRLTREAWQARARP